MKKSAQTQNDENDNDDFFSSGPSDSDDEMLDMNETEREERIKNLWMIMLNFLNMSNKTIKMYKEIFKDFVVYTDDDFTRQNEKQMIKMFGTINGLEYKEREVYTMKPKWYVILPTYKFNIVWNLVIMFLLIYIATVIPYRIAFIENTTLGWTVWDYITDALFIIDFAVNCITAYTKSDGTIETRVSRIIWNYFRGWMLLDFFACIPFQLVGSIIGANMKGYQRLARLPRLYKLIRILRILKLFKVIENNQKIKKFIDFFRKYSGIIRFLKIVCYSLMMIHWVA